jgi:hypothetical protein
MLSGILLTLAVLVILLGLLGVAGWLWVRGSSDYINERVRIGLERHEADQRINQMTFAAMQAMVNEARQSRS